MICTGSFVGFPLPLIPLLFIYKLSVIELFFISYIGNFLIFKIFSHFDKNYLKFSYRSKFKRALAIFIDFIFIHLQALILLAVLSDYYSSLQLLNRISLIALLLLSILSLFYFQINKNKAK